MTGKASPIRGRYEIRPRRDRTHARRQFRPSNLGVVFCLAGSSTGSIAVRIDQPTTGSSAALRPHHKWKWPVQTFRPRSGTEQPPHRASPSARCETKRVRVRRRDRPSEPVWLPLAPGRLQRGAAAGRCFFVHHACARGSPAFAGRGAPTGTAGAGRDPAAAGAVRPSHAHGRRVSARSGGLAAQRRPPRPTSSCGSRQAGGRRVATAGPVSEWKFSCVGVQLITNSRW